MTHNLVPSSTSVLLPDLELVASSNSSILEAPLPAQSQMMGEPSIVIPVSPDSQSPEVGEDVDILWRHSEAGQVLGWFLDQLQVENSHLIGDIVSDSNWVLEGTGDFNNDSQEDLLWRHTGVGQVVAWYMNNGELQQSALVGDVVADTRWEIEGVGDFNRDGNDDILWRHYSSGQVFAWHMDGAGNIQGSQFIGPTVPDLNWRIEGIGDFNGDQVEDLLWRHYASGQNLAFHLDAQGQVVSSAPIGTVISDLNWTFEGVGDFNQDGETDILLHHALSGENLAWLMNDNNVVGGQHIGPTVPDNQWTPIVSRRSLDSKTLTAQSEALDPVAPEAPLSEPAPSEIAAPEPAPEPEPEPAPEPEPEPVPEPEPAPEPDSTSGFDIEFDYRFDTQGWFTPERRAALEASADVWEGIILDDFETTSAGTRTPFVRNPQTNLYVDSEGNDILYLDNVGRELDSENGQPIPGGRRATYETQTAIEDLRIFVGARSFVDNQGRPTDLTLGESSASGYFFGSDRYAGDDFEPWLGSIAFNSNVDWFFDPTPTTHDDIPNAKNDFMSTVIHEIGHILGFSSSIKAFANHLNSAGDFAGPNAMAQNGGAAIPLEGSHIEDGYEFGGSGETVLDPSSFSGVRQLPTALDIAIFDDIGYEVDYSKATQNQSESRDSGISGDTGSNRMAAHDSLAPDCCSCDNCQSNSLQLALTGETSLEEMVMG